MTRGDSSTQEKNWIIKTIPENLKHKMEDGQKNNRTSASMVNSNQTATSFSMSPELIPMEFKH